MQSFTKLFKSYPSGTAEYNLYRKCYNEFKKGQYSAAMCIEIEKRTEGAVMAKTLRPDLFEELDHETTFKRALYTWVGTTKHPTPHDTDLINAALERYKERDPEFYAELKAVAHVL